MDGRDLVFVHRIKIGWVEAEVFIVIPLITEDKRRPVAAFFPHPVVFVDAFLHPAKTTGMGYGVFLIHVDGTAVSICAVAETSAIEFEEHADGRTGDTNVITFLGISDHPKNPESCTAMAGSLPWCRHRRG